jgi:high-affinity nickel-transport protein
LGFFLGMRHATDPDHVIAVTTIVTRKNGIARAGLIGALWGLGHTFTIFVVGSAIILFKVAIPPRVGLSMEFAVGLMLILLGVLNLTGVLRWLQERLSPGASMFELSFRDGSPSSLARAGRPSPEPRSERTEPSTRIGKDFRRIGFYNALRPIVIGIIHGLAGSAAVALLVMTTIANPWWAVAYLLLFGVGTVAGMILITSLIAMPFAYSPGRFSNWNRSIAVASGLLSMCFGIFLSYKIGVVYGLFTDHPQWTPR